MTRSVFDEVASSLTVGAICDPVGVDVPTGSDLADVEEITDPGSDPALDPLNNPSRVIDPQGRTIGMLWYSDWYQDDPSTLVDDVIEPIEPHNFLSSSTTILDAMGLFSSDRTFFYVINCNDIVGVLRYRNLFKALGRLALLALALEIEYLALRLCQSPANAERCWNALPISRRRKASKLYKQRYGENQKASRQSKVSNFVQLIECTQIIDKATMIWKLKLVRSSSRSGIMGTFHKLMKIRDLCAHPGDDISLVDQLPNGLLHEFINSSKDLRNSIIDELPIGYERSRLLL